MNSRLNPCLRLVTACALLGSPLLAADEFRFVKATPENTTLADGTPLKVVPKPGKNPAEITCGPDHATPDNHWHWREGRGSGAGAEQGLFTASGQKGNNAPMLRTLVGGLKPKTTYSVHGFFWIAGTSPKGATPAGDQNWDIRFGTTMAGIRGFSHTENANAPGTCGIADGDDLIASQAELPLRDADGQPATDRNGDTSLFRALLGVIKTDEKGSLVTYIDDLPDDRFEARSCYDGIGVSEAPEAMGEAGAGSSRSLTLAARAGDWETMRRELEAGADPNVPDNDNLTALAYLCVAGERERVKDLLDAGARPEVEGQALSPLWIAAKAGDAEVTGMLLDAGAPIPLEPLFNDKLVGHNLDVIEIPESINFRHPTVAAIHSGSVETLKRILKQEPRLELVRLYCGISSTEKNPPDEKRRPCAVRRAVAAGHEDMAVFLISKGFRVNCKEATNVPRGPHEGYTCFGSRTIVLQAVLRTRPMEKVLDALAKRGVQLVDFRPLAPDGLVVPWDALSAAVWMGHADLVRRLLPQATRADGEYRTRLAVLAEHNAAPDVLAMVRQQFPKVDYPDWPGTHPVDLARLRAGGEVPAPRPRVRPPVAQASENGAKQTLAVIGNGSAAGPAAALAAKASEVGNLTVVERREIDKLLNERGLRIPGGNDSSGIIALGDVLLADLLITVNPEGEGATASLRFEAASVKTGLVLDRDYLPLKGFRPDDFCPGYLSRICGKLAAQNATPTLTAVTLLPIASDPRFVRARTLANLVGAGLRQEIDATPGMITLTRDQMQPLAEENALGQSGGMWGAGWTIEGGLRRTPDGETELSLRLQSLAGDTRRDVKVTGSPDAAHKMVREAWRQTMDLLGAKPAPTDGGGAAKRAEEEAARLLREAERMSNYGKSWDAEPLVDAALYLGADPLKALQLKMLVRMQSLHFWNPRLMMGHQWYRGGGFPTTPRYHDLARRSLPEHLDWLRLNREVFDRVAPSPRQQPGGLGNDKLADLWSNLAQFVRYRSYLCPLRMSPKDLYILQEFDTELQAHCKRMFAVAPAKKLGGLLLAFGNDTHYFRVLPWLGSILADEIVSGWPASDVDRIRGLFGSNEGFRSDFLPVRNDVLCDLLARAMKDRDMPLRELRLAELAYLRTSGVGKAAQARKLWRVLSDASAALSLPVASWVSPGSLAKAIPCRTDLPGQVWGTTRLRDFVTHGDSFIPDLVHAPRYCPESMLRGADYAILRRFFSLAHDPGKGNWNWTYGLTVRSYEAMLNEIARAKGRLDAATCDRLLGAAGLLDRIIGAGLTAHMEPRVAKLRAPEGIKFFGTKGQFPILDFKASLVGHHLRDVRKEVIANATLVTHATVDPKDRNILWLALHPYRKLDLPVHAKPATGTQTLVNCKPPWLVAIDCQNGSLVHKINLAEAGFPPELAAQDSVFPSFGNFIVSGMFFNNRHMLLLLRWRMGDALVLINRKTGEAKRLPKLVNIVTRQLVETDGSETPAIVGVGDSFFVLENRPASMPDDYGVSGAAVWQFTPDTAPRRLVHTGRRPENSPFDAEDRMVTLLRADSDRLLVGSSWEHLAHYDPAKATWSEDKDRTSGKWRKYVRDIDTRDFQASLFPHHRFVTENGRVDTFGGPDFSEPGRLVYASSGKDGLLPVRLAVPESYRARFLLSPDPSTAMEPEWLSASDLARSHLVVPVIFNQTADHFVLGLRFKTWSPLFGNNRSPYLPFLWVIDKKTMRAGMNEQSR